MCLQRNSFIAAIFLSAIWLSIGLLCIRPTRSHTQKSNAQSNSRQKYLPAQAFHERNHDRKVLFGHYLAPGDNVTVKRLPLNTFLAELKAAAVCTKLLEKWHGPYPIIIVGPEQVKTILEGVENIYSINCIARVTWRDNKQDCVKNEGKFLLPRLKMKNMTI